MSIQPWSREEANTWYLQQPWLVGCNFIPSTAVNQLEMWQANTFDPETIDRELVWAADLGFNSVRVYLHDLAWEVDPPGFKARIEHYLEIAIKHRISTMFVLFDDCWNPDPRIGPQLPPIPGRHNSRWVQSPGMATLLNPESWDRLENYVKDIVGTFGSDERVLVWDLYNEPGNYFMPAFWLPIGVRQIKQLYLLVRHLLFYIPTLDLMQKVFSWACSVPHNQPLTAGVYYIFPHFPNKLTTLSLELSDVISFHYYYGLEDTLKIVEELKLQGRPLLCTEYLSRTTANHFESHLPIFREEKIGCYNWGLVSGKSQTHCINTLKAVEPPVWGSDILRLDGSPYRKREKETIRLFTGKSAMKT